MQHNKMLYLRRCKTSFIHLSQKHLFEGMNKALLDMTYGANIYFNYCLISQYRNLKVKSENFSESRN